MKPVQSEGQQIAAQLERQYAQQSSDLYKTGEPMLKQSMTDLIKDLGKPGEEPASIKQAYGEIGKETEKQFDMAEQSAPATIGQEVKQSGYRGAAGSTDAASTNALIGLEQRRRESERKLKEQETDAAMSQRDFDLSSILGIAEGGISQSFGFGKNAITASQYDTKNPGQGALTGAVSGAGLGAEFGPYGALIGGAVGAVGGYFASGG